ncbi:MAG: 50S ribosomal protein L11 methyltransferase [Verrucomicrobiales bacterium]
MFVWSKLSSEKWRDAWEERFLGHGQTNAVVTALPGRTTIRVEVYTSRKSEALKLKSAYGGSVREIRQAEWSTPVAPPTPPMRIRGKFIVTNVLEPEETDPVRLAAKGLPVLHVPPGLAFGTGDHATTSTCLRVLADFATERKHAGLAWSMADLGTGTGILAMAAGVCGAEEIYAMDFDPLAVKAARANFRRNHLRKIKLEQADLTNWTSPRKFDFVAANVFADVLTLSLPRLKRALAKRGRLVISGILRQHWPDLEQAALAKGIRFDDVRIRGKWVTATGGHA